MTSDKYATMLLSLVESCIPEDMLRIWLRNPFVSTAEEFYTQNLKQLLKFLRLEVQGEQRVLLAKSGFKSDDISRNKTERHRNEDVKTLPTSAALVSTDVKEWWSLETIGIRDPFENLKRKERNSESIKRFGNNFDILPDGRYQLNCRSN
ncbi:hypothetical protein TNCV_3001751 [Trichonephila clavipes]|nr:hypothetical protein TNCV_3001751 [Trichonephila clavipes]